MLAIRTYPNDSHLNYAPSHQGRLRLTTTGGPPRSPWSPWRSEEDNASPVEIRTLCGGQGQLGTAQLLGRGTMTLGDGYDAGGASHMSIGRGARSPVPAPSGNRPRAMSEVILQPGGSRTFADKIRLAGHTNRGRRRLSVASLPRKRSGGMRGRNCARSSVVPLVSSCGFAGIPSECTL